MGRTAPAELLPSRFPEGRDSLPAMVRKNRAQLVKVLRQSHIFQGSRPPPGPVVLINDPGPDAF
jgi:hypothetical protein